MRVCIQHKSSAVSEADARLIVEACQLQVLEDLAPAWGLVAPQVTYVVDEPTDPEAVLIVLLDDADVAGALGYHDETPQGRSYGRVFAKPVLDAGGTVLTGSLSVAAVASHEVCETVCDAHVNGWDQAGDGTLYAVEVCDPVEADGYTVRVNDEQDVAVSNFVLPAWFDPQADVHEPVDHLGLLPPGAPFALRAGGYAIVNKGGQVSQMFGRADAYPAWRKATKEHPASRTARRLHAHG